MNFWTLFAAVLAANLLTVMFVWGMYSYSKHEKGNEFRAVDSSVYIGMALPMLFLIGGLYVAFGY